MASMSILYHRETTFRKLESLQDLHEKERAAWHMRNSKETMTRQEVEAQLNGVHGDQRALEFELKLVTSLNLVSLLTLIHILQCQI